MKVDAGSLARGCLIGAGAWVALGATSTLDAGQAARTLGLLPPAWLLAVALAAGILLMHACRHRPISWTLPVLTLLTTTAAWLPVPSAPWIHAWSSPASVPVFVIVAVAIARSSVTSRRPWTSERAQPWIAAALATSWLIAMWLALGSRGISGDEPHYLLIARSLLGDGDFDLRNNYDARDLLPYYPGPLEPRHVSLGVLGQEYSFHGPGVALLTLPAFAIGGPLAARLLVALVVAASSGLLWSILRELTESARASWMGWATFIVSAPLGLNGTMVYPDGPGAAATIVGLWALARAEQGTPPSHTALAFVGFALAALPWLHLRLALVAVCVGVGLIVTLWKCADGVSRIASLLAAPIAGAVLLFASTWLMFGTLDPTAVFRQQAAGSLAAAPTGLLGLLFDQEYGLLPYAPCFALGPVGIAILWRRRPVVCATAAVAAAGTLLVSASWVWWGGQSAPARFLVPILPLLALGVAVTWTRAGTAIRSFIGVGLAFSASLSALMATADDGAYAINVPDGRGSIFEWLSPSVDLSSALPSLFRSGSTTRSELTVAVVWVATFALAALCLHVVARWTRRPAGLSAAAVISVIACSFASGLVWSWRDLSPWTNERAALTLLFASGYRHLPISVMSPGPRPVPRADLLSTLSISAPRSQSPAALLHVPMLPAGRYRIEAEPASPRPLTLELGQDAWPLATWRADTPMTFVSAFPVRVARVTSAGSDARQPGVLLQPLDVWQAGSDDLAWRVTAYGPLIVYSLDRSSYPETGGLWLAANRTSAVAISDREGRARAAGLRFEAGESAVAIAITDTTGWRSALSLAPGDRGHVALPMPTDGRPRPIRIAVDGGFTAADGRGLGAWLSVEPQH